MIGMTAEKFWQSGLDYYVAHKIASMELQRQKQIDNDTLAWRIGGYVAQALMCVPIMAYGMTESKAIRKISKEYPNKPNIVTIEEEEKAKQKQLKERVKASKPTEEQLTLYHEMLANAKLNRKGN